MSTHRSRTRRSKKLAALGAATVTATALTVGAAPPPKVDAAKVGNAGVDLLAGIQFYPPPGDIPDLTFGLGTAVYDFAQSIAAQVETAIVENISLVGLAQATGLDPESLLNNLLNTFAIQDVLQLVVDEVLNELTVNLGLGTVVGDLVGGLLDGLLVSLVAPILNGLTNAVPVGDLLRVLGIDLSQPLNLSDLLDLPGLNVVTTGSAFSLLKMIGLDLGWAPSLPNSIADEINNTDYLTLGLKGLIEALIDVGVIELPVVGGLVSELLDRLAPITGTLPDVLSLRVPIALGFGMGAFAAGAAYEQIVADLPNQPGGANWKSLDQLLGSITILPMVLLRNPGRANGGLLARMYPLAGLFGINTVTPETEVQHSGLGLPGLGTGLSVGAANLIPVKIDATVQYDIMSDFTAWPNPFSLANNLAAGLLPTYLLRGLSVLGTTGSLLEQLAPQLADIVASIGDLDDPLALNLYLTLPMNTLPLLEPLYLATDFINLFTPTFDFNNPIATALNPVLSSLVNLGYTDVFWDDATGQYGRTLTEAHIPTGFGTLPDINWLEVPGNLFTSLLRGVQDAFEQGLTAPKGTNALRALLGLLGLDLDLDLGGLGARTASVGPNSLSEPLAEAFEGPVGDPDEISPMSVVGAKAAAVPNVNAKTVTITTNRLSEGSAPEDGPEENVDTSTEDPADDAEEAAGGDTEKLTPGIPRDVAADAPSSKLRTLTGNGRTEVRTGLGNPAERLQQRPGQRMQDRNAPVNKRIHDTRNTHGFGADQATTPSAKVGAGVGADSDRESGGDE